MDIIRHKLIVGGILLSIVVAIGTFGYYLLAMVHYHEPHWALADCLYMTIITLTTVGFGEVIDLTAVPGSRIFTIVILLSGLGISAYFISTFTAFLVEGELKNVFWRNRMNKDLEKMKDHVILCGVGRVGRDILIEFMKTGQPVVVIERNENIIIDYQARFGDFIAVIGDATHEDDLRRAGVNHALGVITTMEDDKDNLCTVVTCRALNPKLRVVTRCSDAEFAGKLKLLGAEVVLPNYIGGLRMASQMVRPRVVKYLDIMLRDKEMIFRIEEFQVLPQSPLIGVKIGALDCRSFGNLLLLAVLHESKVHPIYNPESSYEIEEGDTLVFQAEAQAILKFRQKFA